MAESCHLIDAGVGSTSGLVPTTVSAPLSRRGDADMVSMGTIITLRRARIAETFRRADMSGSRNIDGITRGLLVDIIVRMGRGKHSLSAPRCLIVRQPTRRQPHKDHPVHAGNQVRPKLEGKDTVRAAFYCADAKEGVELILRGGLTRGQHSS